MIPKKVYISIAVWDEGRKYDFLEVSERPYQTTDTQCHWREYTDLSQVWHNPSKEPKEFPIICQDELSNVWIQYSLKDYIDGWEEFKGCEYLTRWAYIDDLLPKQFGNSEQLKGDEK